MSEWLNIDTCQQKQALRFGITSANPALRIPELASQVRPQKRNDSLLFDALSKRNAGPVAETVVDGLLTMGVTSDNNCMNYYPEQNADGIQMGVIQHYPEKFSGGQKQRPMSSPPPSTGTPGGR